MILAEKDKYLEQLDNAQSSEEEEDDEGTLTAEHQVAFTTEVEEQAEEAEAVEHDVDTMEQLELHLA